MLLACFCIKTKFGLLTVVPHFSKYGDFLRVFSHYFGKTLVFIEVDFF